MPEKVKVEDMLKWPDYGTHFKTEKIKMVEWVTKAARLVMRVQMEGIEDPTNLIVKSQNHMCHMAMEMDRRKFYGLPN